MAHQEEILIGRRLKTSYISTVVSITLVLFVLGLLGLIIMYAQKLSTHVKENIGFSVIIFDTATPAEILNLNKTLDTLSAVKSTEFISSDKAAEELSRELGEDFVAFLGYNPLFPSIEVKLNAQWANPDSLAVFENEIKQNPVVKEVDYQKDLVHLVNENVRKIGVFLLVFGSLFLIIAFTLINNTIRLSVFSKRFIIKSMQLVGATHAYISRPFIIKGIVQGIIGASIAISLLMGILYFAQQSIPELIIFHDIEILFALFAIVLFLGIIISWISTYFAIKKYLKMNTDLLFFY